MATLTYISNTFSATCARALQSLMVGLREDVRVRWAAAAAGSVMLSAGIWGVGGVARPIFAVASIDPYQHTRFVQVQEPALSVVDMSTSTVAQIIQTVPDASRFELMLYNSGAEEELSGAGTFTVFVPTRNSFDYLPKRTIAQLSRPQLKDLAEHHIINRTLGMEESLNGNIITRAGDMLSYKVDTAADQVTVDGAQVVRVYKGSNGMVYLINQVLVDSK